MQRIERLKYLLSDRRLYTVAKETGLTYQAIRNLLTGKVKDPKISTVEKLEQYFANR